jgi:hypothetical protein
MAEKAPAGEGWVQARLLGRDGPPSAFVRRREEGRLVLLPAPGAVRQLMVGMVVFVVAAQVMAVGVYFVFGPLGPVLSAAVALFGLLAGVITYVLWRRASVPLVVEGSGRVRFGDKELVAPGAAREVFIERDTGGEVTSYDVYVRLEDGKRVELPGPYFSCLMTPEEARELAGEVAGALRVKVADGMGEKTK